MKYYEVKAKCGHVGRNNYIVKEFYTRAENGREAASKIRRAPRVKHDHKDAIISVEEISCSEFYEGIKKNENDNFFKIHSSSEQRLLCTFQEGEIIRENLDDNIKTKKKKHIKQRLIELQIIKEWRLNKYLQYE